MASHTFTVETHGDDLLGAALHLLCSCDAVIDLPSVTLDEINRLAHEHIEAAERAAKE